MIRNLLRTINQVAGLRKREGKNPVINSWNLYRLSTLQNPYSVRNMARLLNYHAASKKEVVWSLLVSVEPHIQTDLCTKTYQLYID